MDLWIFQKREIEDARVQPGEDEQLEGQKKILANAEKIYNAAMNAFDLLYDGRFNGFDIAGSAKQVGKNSQNTSEIPRA